MIIQSVLVSEVSFRRGSVMFRCDHLVFEVVSYVINPREAVVRQFILFRPKMKIC